MWPKYHLTPSQWNETNLNEYWISEDIQLALQKFDGNGGFNPAIVRWVFLESNFLMNSLFGLLFMWTVKILISWNLVHRLFALVCTLQYKQLVHELRLNKGYMNKKSTGLDWYYSKSFWKLEFQVTNSKTTCCLFILPDFNSFEKDPPGCQLTKLPIVLNFHFVSDISKRSRMSLYKVQVNTVQEETIRCEWILKLGMILISFMILTRHIFDVLFFIFFIYLRNINYFSWYLLFLFVFCQKFTFGTRVHI